MSGDLSQLWIEPRERLSPAKLATRAVGSIAAHVFLYAIFVSLPEPPPRLREATQLAELRQAVHIVYPRLEKKPDPPPPPKELTQKAPNKGKISRELDVRSATEASQSRAPATPPPSPPPGASAPPQPVIEAPKLEVVVPPTAPGIPNPTTTPAITPLPEPKQQEKAKMAFERVGGGGTSGTARIPNLPAPNNSVEAAARAAMQNPGAGGMVVGDTGIDSARSNGAQGAPASGPMGSQLQLLSDPQNVDFKPYLMQILGMVRRNWFAVIPESARLGTRRGLTVIQFIVDRKGAVPKLVIATPSGTEAFDRAAVASVSASYPFPPLPPEYKGADVRLQLAFAYNMNK